MADINTLRNAFGEAIPPIDAATARQILVDTRGMIFDRSRWCQGSYAMTAEKEECLPDDPRASCFCATGALATRCGVTFDHEGTLQSNDTFEACLALLRDASLNLFRQSGGIVAVNDGECGGAQSLTIRESVPLAHANTMLVFEHAISALPT